MKFTPEVIAALQTLKDAVESDFERHRIAVLERDLTEPPKPEIIDENHQKFSDLIFDKDHYGHFRKMFSIHRAVYIYYFGEIPAGYEIHHIDENKSNNDISNLVMLSKSEHQSLHHNGICYNKNKLVKCKNCGKKVEKKDTGRNAFCSKKCRNEFSYKNNQIILHCKYCGKEFSTWKYSGVECCSPKCAQNLLGETRREERQCPVCGKTFETKKSAKKVCCSYSCSGKLRWSKKKSISNLPIVLIDSAGLD